MGAVRFDSELLEINKINEDTKIMKFSVPKNFNFEAGQYVNIAFYKEGKRIIRSYSIFSSPSERGYILIYLKKVEGGFASNSLFNLKNGEKIEMKGPMGIFKIKDKTKDLVFISTGTGFGPFRSMIFDLIENGSRRKIILIRGYRDESSICCEEELKKLKLKNKNFEFYDCLSRPKNKGSNFEGRIQEFFETLIPKNFEGDFYLCGLKEMIGESRDKLLKLGFSKENIFFERYD